MAQINGVYEITGESAIEVNGERYELVEGPGLKGDIAKVVQPWGSQVKGGFYPVINEDHFLHRPGSEEKHTYIAGEICTATGNREDTLIFRKVKTFEAGEKVRLIAGGGHFPLFGFKDGDTYEVMESNVPHPNRGGLRED